MEEIKKVKTSFWSAVKNSCVRIDIFQELKEQNIGRAIWHLFLLSAICSIFIMMISGQEKIKNVDEKINIFTSYAGGIDYQPDGFYPMKDRENSFSFLLANNMKVVYMPITDSLNKSELISGGITYLWSPKGFFGVATDPNLENISVTFYNGVTPMMPEIVNDFEALEKIIKERIDSCKDIDYSNTPKLTPDVIVWAYVLVQFFGFWIQYFWMMIIVSLLFAFFYFITGVTKRTNMSFREFFSISIYAGFPPMLVSAIFAAFDLPFIRYNTVLSLGWLVYLLVILNSLLKSSIKK